MKNYLIFSFIILLTGNGYSLNLTHKSPADSTQQKNSLIQTASLPLEKIFLHLDRPGYLQGDTIWFKAYAWFGFDQLPDTVSKVMHVELLNREDSILMKRKLLIQNGTSNGEFILSKEMNPGKYLVRAYTRWMQNENAGEPFYQTINVSSLSQNIQADCSPLIIKGRERDSLKITIRFYEIDQQGDLKSDFAHKVEYKLRIGDQQLNTEQALISSANSIEQVLKFPLPEKKDSLALLSLGVSGQGLRYEKEFRIPLDEGPDLQFFPEGGFLTSGLRSRVAFKAIGSDGAGRQIKGVIKSTDGNVLTSFDSFHKGMGDFYLTPETGKKYQAYVIDNGKEVRYNLPDAINSGCSIKVEKGDSVFSATLLYTPEVENSKMYLAGSSYGKLRFIFALKLTPDSCGVKIPLENLPEGISKLTLLNDSFKPMGERLVYIDKKERFKIEVNADSVRYGTRSKVTLHIRTTDSEGNPVPANLSLSVTDTDQVKGLESLSGISAYKLLESELKGTIEDPGFYFRGDSVNSKALDLLLLTQGYRRFLPDSINKAAAIRYYPERSFEINGKVALRGEKGKNFNYSSLGLTLLNSSDKTFFDQSRPDSTGLFSFQLPLQSGKTMSLIRAYNSTGKLTREKLPKEKSFRGDISLEEEDRPHFEVPELSETTTAAPLIESIQQLREARKNEISKIKNGDKWNLNLPEVTVTAKYKDKEWYTRFEENAKKIVDMDSLDPTGKKYEYLNEILLKEFGARKYRNPIVEMIFLPAEGKTDYFIPIYLLNGQIFLNAGEDFQKLVALLNMLHSIRVNEIKKLMVIPPGNITFHYADSRILMPPARIEQSMVVIETYSKKNFYRGDPDGIKTFILEGLDSPRVFYSPKYEGPDKTIPDYDSRATLLWKPVIRTNEKGESQVEFYTSDRKSSFQLKINGIGLFNGNTGEYSK